MLLGRWGITGWDVLMVVALLRGWYPRPGGYFADRAR